MVRQYHTLLEITYALSKQVNSVQSVQTSYGPIELDKELAAAVSAAVKAILERRMHELQRATSMEPHHVEICRIDERHKVTWAAIPHDGMSGPAVWPYTLTLWHLDAEGRWWVDDTAGVEGEAADFIAGEAGELEQEIIAAWRRELGATDN